MSKLCRNAVLNFKWKFKTYVDIIYGEWCDAFVPKNVDISKKSNENAKHVETNGKEVHLN